MNKFCAYISFLGLLFCLYPHTSLFAGNPEKTILKGHKLWENDQIDSAIYYYQIARREAISQDNWASWVKATEKMGRAMVDQGQFESAKIALDSAIMVGEEKLGRNHLVTLNALSQLGVYFQGFGEFQKALDQHLEVLEILKQNPQTHDTIYAGIHERLSLDYYLLEEFDKAYETTQKGIELLRPHVSPDHFRLGFFENTLGILSAELGKNNQALKHYQKALEILINKYDSTNSRIITLIGNMGNIAMDEMDYQKSYHYFLSTIPYLDETPVLTQCVNLYSLGLVLNLMGDYEQGALYLEESRKRISIAPEAYQPQLATIEYEIARAFTEAGEYDKAIIHLNRTIEIYNSLEDGYLSDESNCFLLMGIIFHEQEKFAEAHQNFQQAQDKLIPIYGEQHPQVANNYSLMGQTLLELGEIDEARRYFQTSLAIYREMLPANHPYLNETLVELAITYRVTEEFETGIELCQQAIKGMTGVDTQIDYLQEGLLINYWPKVKVEKAISEYAILLKERFKKENDIKDLEKASLLFHESLSIIDSMRHTFQTPSSKSEIIREYNYIYEEAIETEFLLYRHTGVSEYLEAAFAIVEQTKSRNLLESIWRRESINFANVPDSILEKDRILKRKLDYYKTEMESSDSISASTQDSYYQTHKEYQGLMQELEGAYPDYYHLKYPSSPYASYISDVLQPNQVAYNYFWGIDQLFIFRHYKGETAFYEIGFDSGLEASLSLWLNFITQPPTDDQSIQPALEASFQLYNYLLPDLPDSITNILVFPDGKLGYLPIESLLTQAPGAETDYRKLPFLIKEQSVIYANSAYLWTEYQGLSVKTHQLEYLGFAPLFGSSENNPSTSRSKSFEELDPLIFNQDEVKQGANLFGGKAFTGEEVNENLLSQNIEQTILHFATHARVDQENPLNSQLFLSLPKRNIDDGILHGYEIYNLHLNSPLVILSACETGTGTFRRGEGIMSLARAFQYAGSKTLISTLWRAEDQSAF